MFRRWFTPRTLLALVSVGLIVVGLSRMLRFRTPDRPTGSWEEIRELSERGDLNVVFILIDTLRADRLSAYGYERSTSPVFDALAETGILFRDVLAQSTWTKASMASLWTASYPTTTGITRFPHGLPDEATMPAEIFRDAGYRTVGIWRNGWVAPNFGFGQGFDLYFRPPLRSGKNARADNPSAFRVPGTDQDATLSAVEFLRGVGDERFFLYMHYMDVHQYVYDDSADFGTTYSDIYDNSIAWVDKNVGHLMAVLQREELMRRTIVVVASDHGEAFDEHGTEGHARNLYSETVRTPLLISLPIRLKQGIRVDTPVENVDIWPTVMELVGLPSVPGNQGRSLLPVIEATARGEEDSDRSRTRHGLLDTTWGKRGKESRPMHSVGDGRYRLIQRPEKPEGAQLFQMEEDRLEQHDIAADNPDVVERLRGALAAHLDAAVPAWGGPEQVSLDDFELSQLRALGYAVGGEERAPEPDADGDADAAGD
jgi:arylsulfatase A-like enzyme